MMMLRRTGLIVLLSIAGCTADAYQRSADLQVREILKDRQTTALGYEPQVEAPTTVPTDLTPRAFRKIPTTPLPPQTAPPLEPAELRMPYGPLGPPVPRQGDASPEMMIDPDLYGVTRSMFGMLEMGPPLPREARNRFDLFAALEYAVNNSRQYQTQMEELYLTTLRVTLERHLFEPRPFVRVGTDYSGGQRDVNYRAALAATANVGVRQRLPYGGEIVAESLVDFVNAINGNIADGESALVALRGSIPLLRGAGWVNLEPLIQSERDIIYQIRAFEDFRRQFLVDISSRYFQLLAAQQALNNRRLNYANLADLTERTQALYAAGRISFLEVQRSLQSQISAENALVTTRERYEGLLDDFKIVIGMPIEEPLEIVPIELDVEFPDMKLSDAVELAHRYRLDLRTAEDRIEDARRGVGIAENGLLPDLTISADVQARNPDGTPAKNIEERTVTYGASATLDLPVDRVAERNQYRVALIQLQRAHRNYVELRDRVAVAARDALRRIEAAQLTLRLQQAGIELAQRRLDFSNELLRQGKVSARDVVEAQTSLLDAQDAYDLAMAELQIQILRFLQATGTLRVDPKAGALGEAMTRARNWDNDLTAGALK
jgi:hypothetical protein